MVRDGAVQTDGMGFDVRVVVTLPAPATDALMAALDHHFEVVSREVGTKRVTIIEHVSIADEADAVEFVRGLVVEAVPAGSKITDVTTAAG
jgi:hypothetical protein